MIQNSNQNPFFCTCYFAIIIIRMNFSGYLGYFVNHDELIFFSLIIHSLIYHFCLNIETFPLLLHNNFFFHYGLQINYGCFSYNKFCNMEFFSFFSSISLYSVFVLSIMMIKIINIIKC